MASNVFNNLVLEVTGLAASTSRGTVTNYFTQYCSGLEVTTTGKKGDTAVVLIRQIAADTQQRLLQMAHAVDGTKVTVEQLDTIPPGYTSEDIVVRGDVKGVGEEALELFFTNNKKCGGGEIVVIKMESDSEAIITFQDPAVAAKVTENNAYKILGREVTVELVEPKQPPPAANTFTDGHSIVINNVSESISVPLLYLYFDNVAELDGEGGDYVMKRQNHTQLVLTFNSNVDLPHGGVDGVIAKINVTPLEGCTLSAVQPQLVPTPQPVLTNAIRIDNLPTSMCNVSKLSKHFSNKKKSGINKFMRIEIKDKTTAVLYLLDNTAVGAVLGKKHTGLGKGVVLTSYSEGSSVEQPSPVQRATNPATSTLPGIKKLTANEKFPIEVAQNFLPTLTRCQQKIDDLLKVHHAVVHVDKPGCRLIVIPCQGNERVEGWHLKCKTVVKAFVDSLKMDTLAIPVEKKELMKPIIDSTSKTETSLYIEHVEDRCMVILAGEPKEVNKVKKKLDDICKTIIDESIPIQDDRFFLLLTVKLNEISSAHPEIKATIDADSSSVSVTGFKAKCEELKTDLFLVKDNMQCVPVLVTSPAAQFLLTENGRELLQYYLLSFKSEVATYFDLEGKLFVLGTASSTGPKDLATKIQNNLCFTHVHYPPLFQKSLLSTAWSEFYHEVEKRHSVKVSVVKNEMKILGDEKLSSLAKKEIEQFIDEECRLERCFKLCNAQWRFVLTHMIKKWRKVEGKLLKDSKKVQLTVPTIDDKDPCIVFKGEKPTVEALETNIVGFLDTIVSSAPIRQIRNCVVKYFSSSQGISAIQQCEKEEKCCIQADIEDASINPSQDNSIICTGQCSKVCTETTVEGLKISLYHGDITALPIDVIVNCANPKLKHTTGVAVVIANEGGACIQEESDALLETAATIKEGDVFVTKKVGNLLCKSLIHVVSPYWKGGAQNEVSLLKNACLKALEKAESFQTITFPAIGYDTHGFPISTCAESMVKAVLDFSQQSPTSSLSEVAFTLYSQSEVNAFRQELSQMFPASAATNGMTSSSVHTDSLATEEQDDFVIIHNTTTDNQSTSKDNVVSQNQPTTSSSNTINIDVTQYVQVFKGDLLNQQADIYVNTVGTDLALSNGAMSRAFLKAGGQALQDECDDYIASHGSLPVAGVVVTKPGAIPCMGIMHTVGMTYNAINQKQSEEILRNIVKKCLIKSEELKASSIAFPALGTGNLCYPADVAAEVMIRAVAEYIDKNLTSTSIKMVKMVIYTDNDYQQFCHALSEVNRSIAVSSSATSVKSIPTTAAAVALAIPPPVSHPQPSSVSNCHPYVAESQAVGSITIEIIVGDITDDDSDAIVNPTNDRMDLSGSAVSNAILKKAGPDLQKKCDNITSQGYRLHRDKVCCTPAVGNLQCKTVFHILVCGTDIAKAVTVCLEEAESNHFNSIAFPAIGTGALGHSLSLAAQNMCESIVTFAQNNPMFVNRIRVIVFQHDVVNDFIHQLTLCQVQAVNKPAPLKSPRSFKRAIDRVSSILHKPKSPSLSGPSASPVRNAIAAQPVTKKSVLVLQVFSDDRKKIQKAEKRLQQLMEDQLSTDVIDDKLINQLSRKEQADIEHKAKIRKIEIKIDIGKFQPNIQLKGDKEDIAELKKEIDEILKEKGVKDSKKKEMQSLIAKVKWQWCNKSGVYEDYDINANYAIEQAYQANTANTFVYENQPSVMEDTTDDDVTDQAAYNVLSEEFDFQQMKATDLSDSSIKYDIKRIELDHSGMDLPSEWAPMSEGTVCHMVTMDDKSMEYREVMALFELTVLTTQVQSLWMSSSRDQGYQIIRIQRIQNPQLYHQYVTRKKGMDQHNHTSYQNERRLFHGCPKDVADLISHQGFNRSFAGKNATVYGVGVYFAKDAGYSAQDIYSPPDSSNNKYMFLVRVLTGEYAQGHSGDIQPPARTSEKDRYDSNVNSVTNPSIFVIFHDAQAYPEYLITFTEN